MHNNSLELFKEYGLPYIKNTDLVLEIGPDWLTSGGCCKPLVIGTGADYAFADIANRNQHTQGFVEMDGEYKIKSPSDMFDVVFSLNVAEHVRDLEKWMTELKRVTVAAGYIIFVNPVSWPYHESPYDCWRIFPEAYKTLFDKVGLEHVFSWTGNLTPLENYLYAEHGPHEVRDTIAIARKHTYE